jgi:hypothetical protein
MIEKDAQKHTGNQKKAMRVQIIAGCKQCNLNAFRAASNWVKNK